MLDVLSAMLLLAGALIVLAGGAGLLRMPDFFCRLHSAGVIDTLGAWLVMAGLVLRADSVVVGFKLVLIVALLMLISPVVSHALSRSALDAGLGRETASPSKERAP